jgi:hypothetical protein
MSHIKLIIASLAIALLASPVGAARNEPAPAPWMVAQIAERPLPTCEVDNRRVPRGAHTCREGKLLVCGAYGNWVDSGKAC